MGRLRLRIIPGETCRPWAGEVFPVLGWIQSPAQVKSVFLEELLGFVLSVCLSVSCDTQTLRSLPCPCVRGAETEHRHCTARAAVPLLQSLMNTLISPLEDSNLQEETFL